MPYEVLHGSNIWAHMECFKMNSRGFILLPYEVLHKSKLWCPMEYSMGKIFGPLWSASKWTLEACFILLPYVVLNKLILWCHMEYSMGKKFGTIWSASKLTLEVSFNHPIECSISQKIYSILCPPWDEYGVLQMYKITNKRTKNWFCCTNGGML